MHQLPELADFSGGIAHVFICHTSASLAVNENDSPDVRQDFERSFNELVPENAPYYEHTIEGPDDMPAHIRSALTQTHVVIPVMEGRLQLGTWQGLFLFEHRAEPRKRDVILHLAGE